MMNSALGLKKHTNKIQGSGCKHLCVTQLLNIYRIAYALIIKIFNTKVFNFCCFYLTILSEVLLYYLLNIL